MNIIFPGDNYTAALTIAGINTLRSRRETLTRPFFTLHVLDEKSCLHYLLPPKRDENITARLRKVEHLKPTQVRQIGFKTHL